MGETETLLPVTVPTPLSMDTEVALLTDHESVVLPFAVIVVAEAEKLDTAGAEPPPEDVELFVPPQPDMIARASRAMHRVRRCTDRCLEACFRNTPTEFIAENPLSIKQFFYRKNGKVSVFVLDDSTVARFQTR